MSRRVLTQTLASVLLVMLGWQLGVAREQSRRRVSIGAGAESGMVSPGATASGVIVRNPERDVDISLLWDVWNALNDHYIDPKKLQVTPLVYGAAEGLARGVGDPYTVFMTPVEDKDFRDGLAGNLEGIGAELTTQDDAVMVVTPLKGSPAERAGILPKDIIIEVEGESTEGWTLNDVVTRVRGPQGTNVKLAVYRDKVGKKEFTITREAIHVPSVESKIITAEKKKIGYIALNQFGEQSIQEFKKELVEFQKQKVDGLVIDLRNNGGGLLDGAIDMASLFIEKGVVVSVERRGEVTESDEVHGGAIAPDLPLAVLQNGATASASEIVAGALQDHKRATIVGEKSFGKGTVQEIVKLSGGSSLRVTVAHWLTPNGKNLGKEGVTPDVAVEGKKPQALETAEDPQLQAAIKVLTEAKK